MKDLIADCKQRLSQAEKAIKDPELADMLDATQIRLAARRLELFLEHVDHVQSFLPAPAEDDAEESPELDAPAVEPDPAVVPAEAKLNVNESPAKS